MSVQTLLRSFVIIAFSFSPFSVAGPLVVGNGGGVAELKAIYMHQSLAGYIAGCLANGNSCGLKPGEMDSLRSVLQNHSVEVTKILIEFDSLLQEPVTTRPQLGADISISSKALYNETGLPKATGQIGALVLAARWSHVSLTPLAELYQRSLDIFASFQEQSARVNVGEFNSGVRFHLNFWRFQNSQQILMFLEDKKTTLDLSSEVLGILPCGGLLDWKWENIQAFTAEPTKEGMQAAVTMDISSSCEPHAQQRTLLIKAVVRESRVEPGSIRIMLRAN